MTVKTQSGLKSTRNTANNKKRFYKYKLKKNPGPLFNTNVAQERLNYSMPHFTEAIWDQIFSTSFNLTYRICMCRLE